MLPNIAPACATSSCVASWRLASSLPQPTSFLAPGAFPRNPGSANGAFLHLRTCSHADTCKCSIAGLHRCAFPLVHMCAFLHERRCGLEGLRISANPHMRIPASVDSCISTFAHVRE